MDYPRGRRRNLFKPYFSSSISSSIYLVFWSIYFILELQIHKDLHVFVSARFGKVVTCKCVVCMISL